jgi:hypothetical protein
LLRSIEGSGSQEVDMAVAGEERDQSEKDGGEDRDPTVTIKSK